VGSTFVLLADYNGDIDDFCIERHNFSQIKFVSTLEKVFLISFMNGRFSEKLAAWLIS
jgi:hypothetical protein